MKPGFRYITKQQSEQIIQALILQTKTAQAHRWLAEFDKLLSPLWSFLLREHSHPIDEIRDEMRKAFKEL